MSAASTQSMSHASLDTPAGLSSADGVRCVARAKVVSGSSGGGGGGGGGGGKVPIGNVCRVPGGGGGRPAARAWAPVGGRLAVPPPRPSP